MALSNKFGWLVLTTGNKSEIAAGYSHPLRRHGRRLRRHQGRAQDARVRARPRPQRRAPAAPLIPESVLEKPPSAELRPDQRDADSLPAYDGPRPDPRGLRGGRPLRRRARGRGLRPGHGRPRRPPGRSHEYKRRQAPPGRARLAQGVRQGPPAARSPTAGPARRSQRSRARGAGRRSGSTWCGDEAEPCPEGGAAERNRPCSGDEAEPCPEGGAAERNRPLATLRSRARRPASLTGASRSCTTVARRHRSPS